MSEDLQGVLEATAVLSASPVRSLGVERVYNLGDYKSIRFSDFISNLPEELYSDTSVVNKISYLQLINVELRYRYYIELGRKLKVIEKVGEDTLQEALKFLEDEKATTMLDIKTILLK